MATYGAKHLQWAPFKATGADESAETFPKYDAPLNLGALVAVSDNITVAEASNYGDNSLQEYVSEFESLTVDIEVTEMVNSVASKVFGAELTETEDLEFGDADQAPYGGLAFYTSKMVKEQKFYQGVYYPKIKASRQGAAYNTKGKSVTFANSKAHFTGGACAKGNYQVLSKNYPTEAEAKAWVDAKIKAAL